MSPDAETPSNGALAPSPPIDFAESTMQENELFRAAFEQSGLGMAHLSTAGIFLRVNARLCEMTGYAATELTGMHFRDVTLASDFGAADEMRRTRVARDGGSYTAERRYVRKNGEVFWVHIATTMLAGPGGSAKYGLSVIEDITARKLAELRLQRLNRLHAVLSAISGRAVHARDRRSLSSLVCWTAVERGGLPLVLMVDIDGATGALHGVAARDSGAGAETVHEDLDGALGESGGLAESLRAGQRGVFVVGAAEPGGPAWQGLVSRYGVAAVACFPLWIGGGAAGALIVASGEADYFGDEELGLLTAVANGLSLGIEAIGAEHKRREVENQLRRQAVLLASAEQIAGVGTWDLDLATGKLDGSDETMRIFGVRRKDFAGTTAAFLRLIHPDDRESLLDRLALMAESSRVVELEYRIVRPDGEERVVLDRGGAIDIDGERSSLRAGMVMDITERRRATREQARHAERLTALVEAQRELAHSSASTEALFDRIPSLVLGVMQADGVGFELVEGDSMLCRSFSAPVENLVGLRFPKAGSLSGEAIAADLTLRSDETQTDPRVAAALCRDFGLRSVLATVVRDGSGPIGVLKLYGYRPAQFGSADADSLELLAEALGATIQRRRADEEVKRSLQIQAGIAAIQQDMIASQDDDLAMKTLMTERAHELTGAMGATIVTLAGDDLVYQAGSGIAVAYLGDRIPRAASLVGLCIERDELLRCDDPADDPRVNLAVFQARGVGSMLTAPLRVGDVAVGALAVMSAETHAFGSREAGTLRILAQWMGAVMQRAVAGEALRASEAQYRLVFAANPMPMWVFDVATLRFLAVNEAATGKYGYSEAEFLAMTIVGIRENADDPDIAAYLRDGDPGGRLDGVRRHRLKDGTVIDIEFSSSAVRFGERPARLAAVDDVSARLRAQRELEKSEAVLAIAGRVARVAGWSVDLRSRVFSHSDDLMAIYGLPGGRTCTLDDARALYTAASLELLIPAAHACEFEGLGYDLELDIVTPDGRAVALRSIAEPVRDAAGNVIGAQGAVQDISEKKRAAEEMKALAARLTTTLDSITDGFYTLDRDWRFTYVNVEAERMLQRGRAELVGRVFWEIFPDAVGTRFHRGLVQALQSDEATTFETLSPVHGIWVEVHAYPSEAGLAIYARDITERRREQEQLRLLQTCVAHMNDVVIISAVDAPAVEVAEAEADRRLRIVFVNDAFVRFTGYPRDEAIGNAPRMLHGPLTDRVELGRIRRALHAGEPVRAELTHYRKDGSTYSVELQVVPIRSGSGVVTHWIGVHRDMTEKHQAQAELRALNESLETRVVERTAALELARHDAEEASRAKSAFVATMSHEIRTPMNGVIGMMDVLEQTELAPDQSRMLLLARDSAHSLMAIIEDILDFSKIEAGKFELERASISVPDIVEKVCALVAGVAATSGVTIETAIDAYWPQLAWGDAGRVRQIVLNLVGNAVKFSADENGGGRVRVGALMRRTGTGRAEVDITVGDNGIGMDADTLGRLYMPFTQADASTTRRFGGTGLGLAITHHLVGLMGGTVEVESTIDLGSTFTVRLPLELVGDATPVMVEPARPRRGGTARRIGGAVRPELILVAEDNEINQKVISAQLKLLGFRAEIAVNGLEALALWRSGRFDILLTDLQMPEMDGYELTAAIRREEGGMARLPIVALTANALKEEAGRCLEGGMDDYLTKPVQLTHLESVLDRLLDAAPRESMPAELRADDGTTPDPAAHLFV